MRTTIMLAPALLREAKARSAQQGESLKALLTRALSAELGRRAPVPKAGARIALPLFGGVMGPRADPTNAELEQALAGVDAERAARTGARPSPARRRARGRR